MSSESLVVGYGNLLRADDGLGWIVAQQLSASPLPGNARVIAAHQLTPELAEPIGDARLVVFVDARAGDHPGRVDCRVIAPASAGALALSHDVDPPSLLEMARLLYGGRPAAVAISVDGADFGYGTVPSAVVQAAIPEVVRQVRTILADGPAAIREADGGRPDPSCGRG